ncbi:MAG: ABC transporter ATP-binding protein [Anaerolineae bacterium]|nr:ABC transporter ATP-binding protein [Anaerolineae bacterium]
MNADPAIAVQNVRKSFGNVHALAGIDLNIQAGQTVGLLGPNGAGKTTLVRLLTGETQQTSGDISVLGLIPKKQKPLLRSQIGYMPQHPALYEDLSARRNIQFFGMAHENGNLPERVDEVIEFVGLTERANDPVYKFSGGMKQRVSLACALVHKPKLLLLDEPTSGIDPKLRESFWAHFRELAASGITILVTTHQMDEAMYCDYVAILHQGKVLAANPPKKLLWENKTKLTIWRGKQHDEQIITNYPENLPSLLHAHGLDKNITRIEIEEETLENVVLRMINNQTPSQKEA